MRQKQMKNMFMVCSVVLGILTMSVQGEKMIVCAEEYEYDDLNRIIKVTYEDGGTVEYVYDRNGNIIETIVSSDKTKESEDSMETDGAVGTPDRPADIDGDSLPDKPAEANAVTEPDRSAEANAVTEPEKPTEPTALAEAVETPKSDEPVENGPTEIIETISLLAGGVGAAHYIRKFGKRRKSK